MTLATLKLTPCSFNEGTGHQANLDILMEKKNFPPICQPCRTDTVTRRSRTGFLIYLNCALVYWRSKKQMSVESSSFGAEFIVMKQCCEYLRGLWYKLQMMGNPVEAHIYVYGDNQSMLANMMIPDSALK